MKIHKTGKYKSKLDQSCFKYTSKQWNLIRTNVFKPNTIIFLLAYSSLSWLTATFNQIARVLIDIIKSKIKIAQP
jgi:hypothetical protein